MHGATDDLSRWFQDRQRSQTRVTKEARHEWGVLKSLVFQFALDNEGIGEQKFTWTRNTGHPRLGLGNAVATFYDRGERHGVPQDCKVLFSFAGGVESPLPSRSWSLAPEIVNGQFAWAVREIE